MDQVKPGAVLSGKLRRPLITIGVRSADLRPSDGKGTHSTVTPFHQSTDGETEISRINSAPLFCALLLIVLIAGSFGVVADDATESSKDEPKHTTIIHANRPVQSIAKSLTEVMRRSDIYIVTNAESNVMILTGSQQEVAKAAKLLEALDQAPQMINIDVGIVVRNTTTGEDHIVDELQMSTLNEVSALLQFGQQVSVPEAVERVGSRTMARSYRRENAGTIVKVTPKLMGSVIVLDLYVEKSWIESPTAAESESDTDDVASPKSYTTVAETTLHLKRGQSRTFRAIVSKGREDGRDVVITVSASAGEQTSTSRSGTTGRATFEPDQNSSGSAERSGGSRSSGAAGSRTGGGFGGGNRRGFGGNTRGSRDGTGGNRAGFGGSSGAIGGLRDEHQSGSQTRPRSESDTASPEDSSAASDDNEKGTSASEKDSAEIDQLERQGRTYFRVLDRDKDGQVDQEEWKASRRLRPMFEEAGVSISSVSEDQFAKHFVTATKQSQQKRKTSEE